MSVKMRLVQLEGLSGHNEPEYELIVEFPAYDTEFAMDFLHRAKKSDTWKSIESYISKNAKDIKIKTVKILAAGVIIAAIPFAFLGTKIEAADGGKFSMTYLYGGTVADMIEQVRSTNNGLDVVSPSYFDIQADGTLKINTVSQTLVNSMHDMGVKVVPFLSNHWDRTGGQIALRNPEQLAAQIAEAVERYNLDGVNVDIENVTHNENAAYTALVKALRNKIPSNKEVSVAVAANPNNWQTGWHGSYDYTQLGTNSDYLMLMTYDEHYYSGDAGPVASIQFIERSIQYALSQTSKDKIVVGLPFFGRIWSNDGRWIGDGVTINLVDTIIKQYNATITYDKATESPKAVFTVKAGDNKLTVGGKTLTEGTYTIWYENEQSLATKAALVYKYDLKGIGSWALGQATDSIRNDISDWMADSDNGGSQIITKTGYVTATSLNVRQSPSTGGNILTSIPKNQAVTLIGSAVNGWYNVRLSNGTTGYVSAQYITLTRPSTGTTTPPSTVTPPPAVTTKTGYVTASSLNVRQSAGTSSPIISSLAKNQSVTLVGNAVNGWYQVKLSNGATGYVSAQYITLTKPSTGTTTPPPTVTPPPAVTTKTGYVTASSLNVRQSASTSSRIISSLARNQSVTLVGNAVNGWYKVKLSNGTTGYVSAQYITLTKPSSGSTTTPPAVTAPTATTKTGYVTASSLNVRQSPSTSSKIISSLARNQSVTLVGNAVNGWYKVKLSNGTTGYVSAQYITLTKPSSSSASTRTGTVTASVLNLRQGRGTNTKIIGKLVRNQKVTVIGSSSGGWYQVRLSNGTTGYVSAQYLKI